LDKNTQTFLNNNAYNVITPSSDQFNVKNSLGISKAEEQILIAGEKGRERIKNITGLNLFNFNPININSKQDKNKKTSNYKTKESSEKKEKRNIKVSKSKKEKLVNLTLDSVKNFDFFIPDEKQQNSRDTIFELNSVKGNDQYAKNKK